MFGESRNKRLMAPVAAVQSIAASDSPASNPVQTQPISYIPFSSGNLGIGPIAASASSTGSRRT